VSLDLSILPSGRLAISEACDAEKVKPAPWEERLISAFADGAPAGLFKLAAMKPVASMPTACVYWRNFAGLYLSALCHTTSGGGALAPIPEPTPAEVGSLLLSVPPMRGAEYIDAGVLSAAWTELDEWARQQIAAYEDGLAGFLNERAPLWHRLGRVCFHLAENKRDPERPFAFMATYSPRLTGDGERVQYQPLSQALKEYAGAKNKSALVKLLAPVHQASKQSELIAELVNSGDIYRPAAWPPKRAYHFLKDVERIESSGVLVRLPDWWKKRPRPRVSVSVGDRSSGKFGADAILDFDVAVTLGKEELTEDELRELLASDEGLVLLRGQWVEVDKERLSQALDHWRQLENENPDGLSFIEGMRLLAGASADLSNADDTSEEDRTWSFVHAGEWLEDVLKKLRSPEHAETPEKRTDLKATLRPYQETGADWLSFTTGLGLGACLADDMGLGKTVQVIAHLLERQRRQPGHLTLLVLPTSLLANWKAEVGKFGPGLKLQFAHPSETDPSILKRLAADPESALKKIDIVLTSYGMLKRLKWLSKVAWDCVVLDEAQAIKNPGSQQTKSVKKLLGKSRIALTGTPVENRLSDLWSLFDFLNPGLLGSVSVFKQFVKRLEAGENVSYAPLRSLVRPYILRRLKTDRSIISDLPDKTEMRAHCGLSRRQAGLYQKLVKEMAETMEMVEGIKRRGLVLAYLMRFKQLCNHPDHLLGAGDFNPSDSGKFQRLGEICEEIASRQEKVLVFTQFREMSNPLASYLSGIFGGPGLTLHGGTAVKQRQRFVEEFQRDGGPSFFVLSLKAGGVGLNLTAASHVIHFDRWWNPAIENQATDRAYRIGQKRNVLVHKFVSRGTVEEKIDELIASKQHLSDELFDGGGEPLLTEMSDDELIEFVSLDLERAGE
jgi:superfamily II DNA or RNA helicase